MKKALYAILAILGLVIIAVIAIPFLVPVERVKQELILAVNDATGRTLAIDGELGVSVFPTLGLTASKVSFSNAPESSKPNMASIEELTVALNLMPLLSGNIAVDKFILNQPVINLEVSKKGTKNWEFDTGAAATDTSTPSSADSGSSPSDLGISDLNLGDVRIIDGTITYADQQNNVVHEITKANLTLELKGLDEPFKTDGSAVWQGETITLGTEVGALRALLENKPSTVKANVSSTKVTLDFDGGIDSLTPLAVKGNTNLDIPSLKDLTAWVGSPVEGNEGTFGPVKIEGTVNVKGPVYSFTDAKLNFDAISGTGSFAADTSGTVPSLKGMLDIPALDVNPYLPEGTGTPAEETAAAKPANTGEKWDSTPIDFSGLKSVNADFKLNVQNILVQKLKIDSSRVTALLKNGVLNLNLDELALYEGKGTGKVMLDARQSAAKIAKSFSLEGLQLQPFLTDAADFDKLEGTGKLAIDITTNGQSQKDMVEKLNGNGSFLFNDGAINGINLAAMARNVTSAFTDSGEAQKTDFAELSGSYTIVNGLVSNEDLKLLNPFIQVTGKGTANIPPKTVDYRVEPKVTASTKGQGSDAATGLVVPIKVTGSWEDPKFAPDLAGVIGNVADPKALKENLENAGKEKLKEQLGDKLQNNLGGDLKKGLGGLLGKD